jgi:UrcA family protein
MSVRLAAVSAVAAIAWLGLSTEAAAATPPPTVSIRIPYSDLDLTSDAGITELYARVRRAARQVCRTQTTGSRVDERYPACMRQTVDRAVAQLGVAALAELHHELVPPAAIGGECAVAPTHRRLII